MKKSCEEYQKIRGKIINNLSEYFYQKSYTHACWLGGSDANNESDKYSDIDFFLCIDDGKIEHTFQEIYKCLSKIGKLDFISNMSTEGNQIGRYYHIEGTPESLLIEIWLIKSIDGMIFEEGHPYFKPKILFDKTNIIKFNPINKEKYIQKIQNFIDEQKDLIAQYARVTTYLNRNNYIESTNYYIKYIYLPLIAVLRVKYTPYLYNWGRIHISRHFPSEVVKMLENLIKLNSINDIKSNLNTARKWFGEIINDIDENGIDLKKQKIGKEIFFIRHGETNRNLYKMINPGDVDSELNKTGINQAKNIGIELKEKGMFFDIIISSPLKRAKDTAKIIANKIGYEGKIIEIDDLKEKYAGVFRNYYKKQFLEEFGVKIVAEILKKYPNKTFKGVEKLEDFNSRINNVIKSIINNSDYNNKKILIVSHGGVGEIITGIKNIENCKLVKVDF